MEKLRPSTYGAELEKTVTGVETGTPHKVSQDFFDRLEHQARARGKFDHAHESDIQPGVKLGVVSTDFGEQGIDNGFNLLETSLPYQTSLAELQKLTEADLAIIQGALRAEEASVVNLSIHPLGQRDFETYRAYVAPKGVYPYIWHRGWDHTAGIDARAQNSPATGVRVDEAADAVSVIMGASAAFVGLYANSPYEEGKRSPYKEARLTMWDRMMRGSKVEGDRTTAQFPPERFRTLGQYFKWMFGGNTGIHFVVAENPSGHGDYKGIGDRILIVNRDPSVLDYLSQPEWEAAYLKDLQNGSVPKPVRVKPHISHMETMQFAQFAGARVRYGLKNHDGFPTQEFVRACKNDPHSRKVEDIFSQHAQYVYIEGRDPGANFPDTQTHEAGEDIASSVTISPSAIQAGLIRNLGEAAQLIDRYDWNHLKALREAAVRDGLQGRVDGLSVYQFTNQVLRVAARGLSAREQTMLRYPEWVIQTQRNGADRAIEFVERHNGTTPQTLVDLTKSRTVVTK